MKPLLKSFVMFVQQIFRDSMLAAMCCATILAACFIRFGVPALETIVCDYFQQEAILTEYYLLFDLLLALITPYMLCFASAMMMLTEYDDNITGYLSVTPVGKRGYLLSRLVFPTIIAFLISIILMYWFSLTAWSWWAMIATCVLLSLTSVAAALMLFSLSHNRVEGMAMAKLSGLTMLGLPVPFFLKSDIQYLFSPLPTFWIAKLSMNHNFLFFIPALLTSMIWIFLLYSKFNRKIT